MRGDYYVYSMFRNYVASDATIILMLITDKALAMLKQRVASSSAWGARLNISGGGCGGYTYELSYAESPNLTDIVYHDILVVDIQSKEYLVDAKLDWVVSELNEMFQITNAKESGRCGCGESFYI
jgi:iron-sulfur cluster assembly accessory protein